MTIEKHPVGDVGESTRRGEAVTAAPTPAEPAAAAVPAAATVPAAPAASGRPRTPAAPAAARSRSVPGRRRKAVALVLLALAACASVVLVLTTRDPLAQDGIFAGGIDIDVYREGAVRALHDMPLYGGPVLYGLYYTYPPFSTLAFIPLGLLPRGDVYLWMAATVVLLAVAIGLCLRLLGHRFGRFSASASVLLAIVCVFLEPVRTTLFFGQINIVLMVLVLWDIALAARSRWKGAAIGLAAGIKLTPVYFVLYYAVLRRWRAAATAMGVLLATAAIAWAVMPSDSQRYWRDTFFDSTRIEADSHPANQSLRGAIARMLGHDAPAWLWLVLSAVVVAVSMVVVRRLSRRGETLLAVALAGLAARVVSPFSWSHHWVWFVPLLVYGVHRALTGGTWRSAAAWWAAVLGYWALLGAWVYDRPDGSYAVGIYLFPAPDGLVHAMGNLYPLLFLVLLGVLAWYVRQPPKTRKTEVPSERIWA